MNLKSIFRTRTPRWLIFFMDCTLVLLSIILSYELRFNFAIPSNDYKFFPFVILYVLFVKSLLFLIAKTYSGMLRYAGFADAKRLITVLFIASIWFSLGNVITYFTNGIFYIPFSIVIIDFVTSSFALTGIRIFLNSLYSSIRLQKKKKIKVLIVGIGETAIACKRAFENDFSLKYRITGFIDTNIKNIGNKIEGVKIYSVDDLEDLLSKKVDQIIFSNDRISGTLKNEITEKLLDYPVKLLTLPPVSRWIEGNLKINQIKNIKIEDLLEREPIVLNNKLLKEKVENKVILISGAAGSIGSELVRQLANYNPQKIILLDNAESALYDIEMELNENAAKLNFEIVLADIRVYDRIRKVFLHFKPQIIFHAAAYKHVPMMEKNPSEALSVNVAGTKIVADLANEFKAESFIMISTDKAVNPTSVMGASKRIAEIYCQSLNTISSTKYITTRFGNVFESNGSVIPRFKKQIEKGGPVTVTHPEIIRYFMTIPEACQLVLEASVMGKGGEVFVFDMGKPVKIIDLAKKMIKLSNTGNGEEVKITFSGLRPGEKLYEELLATNENTLPTHHEKILIAKVDEYNFDLINKEITKLISLFESQDNIEIVKMMKQIVPEFKSNNSEYSLLDNK